MLGSALNFFDGWPVWGVVVCLSSITSLLTEITTNAAISTIFMPIAARMVGSVFVDFEFIRFAFFVIVDLSLP
mgnify:FL=1